MRLLLTNDELGEVRGGTQIFLLDLALELRRRGHDVTIFTLVRGSLAEELERAGIRVLTSLRQPGLAPEVIHGQHHMATMTALCAYSGVPAIYHCHGYSPWQERPPTHPRILRYVGMAPTMQGWMAGLVGRKPEEIVVIPNSVHLGRFHRVRTLGLRPQRALLFGNAFIPGENMSKLRRACARAGMTLDLLGTPYGNPTSVPQEILPDYDVVFAVGRCALEAMASGCAVFPFGAHGCLPMVQPETLDACFAMNFTVPATAPPLAVRILAKRLRQIDGGRAAAVTAAIRSQASFGKTCDRLENLYAQVLAENLQKGSLSPEADAAALVGYLEGLSSFVRGADEQFATLIRGKERSRERIGKLKRRAADLEAKEKLLDRRWQTMKRRLPGWIRSWLLRGVE